MESYKSYGKGRPLIFIHGWSSSPKVWKYQVDHFAKWYNVFTVEPLMENLEKLMADSILDKKPILVGWSYGAMLAKEIIMKYPNKVYAAAFIASNAKFVSSDDYKPGLPRVIVEKLSRDMGRDFENSLMRAYRLFFSEVEKQSGLEFERMLFNSMPDKAQAMEVLDRLKDMDLRDGLYKINIPVLIVHGKKDRICPVEAGRFLKDNIKNAFMHEIDEAGHAPFFTMPERFNSILEGFLSAAYSKKKS